MVYGFGLEFRGKVRCSAIVRVSVGLRGRDTTRVGSGLG